jgi:hypothetical protein
MAGDVSETMEVGGWEMLAVGVMAWRVIIVDESKKVMWGDVWCDDVCDGCAWGVGVEKFVSVFMMGGLFVSEINTRN